MEGPRGPVPRCLPPYSPKQQETFKNNFSQSGKPHIKDTFFYLFFSYTHTLSLNHYMVLNSLPYFYCLDCITFLWGFFFREGSSHSMPVFLLEVSKFLLED